MVYAAILTRHRWMAWARNRPRTMLPGHLHPCPNPLPAIFQPHPCRL